MRVAVALWTASSLLMLNSVQVANAQDKKPMAPVRATKVSVLKKESFDKVKLKKKGQKIERFAPQVGHSGHLTDMQLSADGKILVTASGLSDGLVKVWDMEQDKTLLTLDSEDSVTISPDGKLVAAGNIGGPIKVWNVESGALVKTLEGSGPVRFVAGGELLVGEAMPKKGVPEGTIELWSTKDWSAKKLAQPHDASLSTLATSKDGEVLVTGSYDDSIKVWAVKSGEVLATLKEGIRTPSAIAISHDLKTLAVGYQGEGGSVDLLDLSTGKIKKSLKVKGNVTGLDYSPDGNMLATATTQNVTQLFDATSGKELGEVKGGGEVAFAPDGVHLVHGRRALHVSEITQRKMVKEFAANDTQIYQTVFTPDNKYVLTTDARESVEMWDLKSGKLEHVLRFDNGTEEEPTGELVLSPSGDMVVLRPFAGNTLKVWTLQASQGKKGSAPKVIEVEGLGDVRQVAFAPNNKHLLIESAGDGGDGSSIVWWDLDTNTQLNATKFSGHVTVEGFIDGGKKVALVSTGTNHGEAQISLKLWDSESGLIESVKVKEIPPFGGDIALASEGNLVALGDADNSVKIWDRAEKKILQTLSGHEELVNVVTFSPDGRLLATGGWDETVRIWDVKSGKELLKLEGNLYQAQHITFSPHDDIVAISHQGWLKLIHLPTGRTRQIYYDEQNDQTNWLVYDGSGHFDCNGSGCDMVMYRSNDGEMIAGTDARLKKLKGIEKFGK